MAPLPKMTAHVNLTGRALAAYFRSGGTDRPTHVDEIDHNGRLYVRLANAHTVLAVYRVRNDGMLKRLRRWPADLDLV